MSENDYIAEYVKEHHPEIIKTAHFYFWKILRKLKYTNSTRKTDGLSAKTIFIDDLCTAKQKERQEGEE